MLEYLLDHGPLWMWLLSAGLPLLGALLLAGIHLSMRRRAARIVLPEPPPQSPLPSPNAYDFYLEAARMLEEALFPLHRGDMRNVGRSPSASWVELLDPNASVDQLRRLRGLAQPALQRMREGFAFGYGRAHTYVFGEQYPEFQATRALAKALEIESHLAVLTNDHPRAIQCALEAIRLARDVASTRLLIADLVAAAVVVIGLRHTDPILSRLDEATTERSLQELASLRSAWPTIAQIYEQERYYSLHAGVHAARTGDWAGTPAVRPGAGLVERLHVYASKAWIRLTDPQRLLAETDTLWCRRLHELRRPPAKRQTILPSGRLARIGAPPPVEQWTLAALRGRAILVVEEAYLALRLHFLRHDLWPRSLEDLVPAILPAVPIDPFTEQPLVYYLKGGEPTLYSVGSDCVDNGGVPPARGQPLGTPGTDIVATRMFPAGSEGG
jgi:hypothetical protein